MCSTHTATFPDNNGLSNNLHDNPEYRKKGQVVYHSAMIQLSMTPEVDRFIHDIVSQVFFFLLKWVMHTAIVITDIIEGFMLSSYKNPHLSSEAFSLTTP